MVQKIQSLRYTFHPIHTQMWKSESVSCSVVSDSLQPQGLWPTRLLCPWNSPGKNTGVGSHFLSTGDLPDPGLKLGSPALQVASSPSEPPGKPIHKYSCIHFTHTPYSIDSWAVTKYLCRKHQSFFLSRVDVCMQAVPSWFSTVH